MERSLLCRYVCRERKMLIEKMFEANKLRLYSAISDSASISSQYFCVNSFASIFDIIMEIKVR